MPVGFYNIPLSRKIYYRQYKRLNVPLNAVHFPYNVIRNCSFHDQKLRKILIKVHLFDVYPDYRTNTHLRDFLFTCGKNLSDQNLQLGSTFWKSQKRFRHSHFLRDCCKGV